MHAYAEEPQSATDAAFERMYRRYARDVYRYTLAVLRNPADAEDVTQTTFLNAYRAFQRGESPRKPDHWLIKIAHNACRSRYVHNSRRPREVPLDESLSRIPLPADDAIDLRDLLAALGELPFNQRAALVMRELDGHSYREIAETLDVTIPAVETLIFRARRRLRAERSALQALGAVPLPPSLASFFGGAGAVAGGSALLGSGLALKAAIVVAAGVVAGGVATKQLTATASPAGSRDAAAARHSAAAATAAAGNAVLTRNGTVVRRADGRGSVDRRAAGVDELSVGARHHGAVSDASAPGAPDGGTVPAPGGPSPSGDASVTPGASTSSQPSSSPGSAPGTTTVASSPAAPSPTSAVETVTSSASSATSTATPTVTTPTVTTPTAPSVPSLTSAVSSVTSLVPPPPPLPTTTLPTTTLP
ncbi:MAG TPA: sigma-70 family RNA polymerase sigma factor [Gaiellaceae bacterium]